MPELPEVEAARRAAHKVATGRRIIEAHVADDPIVFEGVAPARFRRALVGRRVKAVRRHGKHLWLEL
ncbi:MAG TPA: DNA-formamidopyrimidine glycosylase family protein, partial [Methylomirabilota bacterium]|nr:DNA-formamidopyrimidine glycosylase family protein [Methylomirabilota bacterium]